MIVEIVLFLAIVFSYIYSQYRKESKRWEDMGVKQLNRSLFPLGNNAFVSRDTLLRRRNLSDSFCDHYRECPGEKMFVTYVFVPSCKPVLILRDVNLIQDVLVKDFNHFVDRLSTMQLFGRDGPTKTDLVWQRQLVNLKGEEWKDVRSMFSPIFTSGKLKMMVKFMDKISKSAEERVRLAAESGEDLELRDLFSNLSIDTIASCAFGIEAGASSTIAGADPEFARKARRIFSL